MTPTITWLRFGSTALAAALLAAPAMAANPAHPGTVNYVEGAAFVAGTAIHQKDVGTADLNPGEVLSTEKGKAELLLTPGVFLRLDSNSAVKMVSPELTRTEVELEHGRAGIEVDEIYKQNDLLIADGGVTTQLVKPGYYEFDANNPTVLVFKGKAAVEVGDGKYKTVKDHREMALAANDKPLDKVKPVGFDAKDAQDELYNWNSLRSQYLAEANNQVAPEYAGAAGFYPGWYWNPYGWGYTFIGVDPFWSPFGFGFYPYGGFYGGWGGWYGGGRYIGRIHPGPAHPGYAGGFRGGFAGSHGGFAGGGFHGGFAGGRR